jgi:hypothetical protein
LSSKGLKGPISRRCQARKSDKLRAWDTSLKQGALKLGYLAAEQFDEW